MKAPQAIQQVGAPRPHPQQFNMGPQVFPLQVASGEFGPCESAGLGQRGAGGAKHLQGAGGVPSGLVPRSRLGDGGGPGVNLLV